MKIGMTKELDECDEVGILKDLGKMNTQFA